MKVDKSKWERKKLGELGEIITGNTPSMKEKKYYSSKDYCFFKPGDIEADAVSLLYKSESFVSKLGYEKSRQLSKGSVLVTCIGTIGKIGILDMPATCNQQINAIIPNKLVTSKFLAYSIFSNRDKLAMKANGPVVPIMNKSIFSKQSIIVPPLSEQQAIASELDAIQSLITKYNEQLNDYDNLAKSIFNEMFGDVVSNDKGWERKKLPEITLNRDNERRPVSSVMREKLDKIYDYYGACGVIDKIETYIFDGDFLLIGEDGANLLTAVKPNAIIAKGKFWVNNHAHILQCKFDVDILYLCYCFNCIPLKQYITGVAQPKLNQANLNKILIPLPPLPLQQKFAARITAIESQKDKVKQQITDLQTLFDSRMQYYFD
jgi:type I restriction enzyme S subunit